MPHVRAKKDGRWSVNNEGRDVEKGEIINFARHRDAEFIVEQGLGEFVTANEAIVAMNRENKAVLPDVEVSEPKPKHRRNAGRKAKTVPQAESPPADSGDE